MGKKKESHRLYQKKKLPKKQTLFPQYSKQLEHMFPSQPGVKT